ncbi:hypothetical protein [Arthrobacter sp. NEB 688]|uniref:hypothetical protein n=1 Tax=Arthrobacter sp. NEB 688 TaxID=904039 RepID=UPI001565FA9D|nr:hypothetical protein [Arthrobacter sp. NEB 688]QKE82887.1 hypothetical protein HL663_02255 [Arthrobacter sp. NEB 688]
MELQYDLRADKAHVRAMQKATRKRPDVGLAPVPALVGSWRWWRAIDSGRYPSTILDGTITRVFWGSMGDWPMFTLRTLEGETSDWTRQGDPTRYVEGLAVRLQYVVQRFKDSVPDWSLAGTRETNLIVRIWLEPSSLRSEATGPGPLGSLPGG